MSQVIKVGVEFAGDARGARDALGAVRTDLRDLTNDSTKVHLLDGDTADAKALSGELNRLQEDMQSLAATSGRVKILESAIDSVEQYKLRVTEANAQVSRLQATLSEAYNSGADKSLIKSLERDLSAAEKAAARAGDALERTQARVVQLNLDAEKTGVSTANLAKRKEELAEASASATARVEALSKAIKQEADYQAYLSTEAERAAKAKKDTDALNSIERQRQQALATQKAAEYTRFWADELEKLEVKERQAAASSNVLNKALGSLGIRSAPQIEADILEINQALQKLAIRSNLTAEEFERAATAANGKLAALKAELQGLPVAEAAQGFDLASTALNTLKTAAAGFIGAELGQKFIETNLSADRLQKALQAINGDAQKTASDLLFLTETANRLGINLESSSGGFVKMSAAAKGTRLEGQATRDIFELMSKGMSQLGLSSSDTERAFFAISQMMSKGTVSAEELKGQLGDALPGVMPIAARAVGLTTVEFEKLLASGSVLAEDFLPRFAAEVAKSFGGADGDVQGLSNSIERFKNMWSELLTAVGQGGGLKIMGVAAAAANAVFVVLASTIGVVINGLVGLAETAGVVVAAFTSKDFSNVKEEVSKIGARMSETNEKLAELSNRSLGLASAMATVAMETNAASAEVKSHAKAWEQTNAAFARGEKELNDIAELTKASTAADRERANVLMRIAELSDDDRAKRLAKIEVTRQEAIISQQTAEVLQSEAGLAQSKLLALQKEVEGEKNLNEQKRKAIEDAEQHAKVKAEQAKGAIAAADAARVAAAAAEVEAAAWYDNSGRVKELKAAYEQAALKVDVLKAAQAAGKDVTSELTAAQTASARAHALLTDALRDQTEKISQNLALKQGQINVEQAGVRLAIEQQRTIMEVARAKGDEYGATQAFLEMKKLEIKLAELTAQAKKAEAEAAVLAIKAKREELEATGELTPAKEAELKAQEASAKVKQVEAQVASETAKRLRELTDINQQLANSHDEILSSAGGAVGGIRDVAGAADGAKGTIDSYTASLGRMAAAQAAAGQRGVQGSDGVWRNAAGQHVKDQGGEVVKDKNGKPVTDSTSLLDIGNQTSKTVDLTQWLFKASDSMEEVKAAQKYIGELYEREKATKLTGNVGDSTNYTRLNKLAIDEAVQKALAAARIELATGKQVDLGFSMQDMLSKEMARVDWSNQLTNEGGIKTMMAAVKRAGGQAENQTAAVTINIGGKSQKVDLASVADRDALTGILRQLEADQSRSNI